MAKKTSYLTELIERHLQWKTEGGERAEEGTHDRPEDMSVMFCNLLFHHSSSPRSGATDLVDLWDFDTVRTVTQPGAIGRASGVQASGPPLTWDYNGMTRPRASSGSGASIASANVSRRDPSAETDTTVASSITAKPDRSPPLASSDRSTPRKDDQQATVRHGVVGSNDNGVRREPSDEYDDHKDRPPEDDSPDTTMLDSVVLPAIASVRKASYGPG